MMVEPGVYFWSGNEACVEAAVVAGCRFFAGYPISPSNEIPEGFSERLPLVDGIFMQMEDEIASVGAVMGASWAGRKAMTATSGPGFSLMQETIGWGFMTETPCVIVDVQRVGPGTGQATKCAQGDVMQARWGTRGDYAAIVLSPNSVQEMFELTIRAFNLAEKYRTPVILLADETIGHVREQVAVPPLGSIEIVDRKKPKMEDEAFSAWKKWHRCQRWVKDLTLLLRLLLMMSTEFGLRRTQHCIEEWWRGSIDRSLVVAIV